MKQAKISRKSRNKSRSSSKIKRFKSRSKSLSSKKLSGYKNSTSIERLPFHIEQIDNESQSEKEESNFKEIYSPNNNSDSENSILPSPKGPKKIKLILNFKKNSSQKKSDLRKRITMRKSPKGSITNRIIKKK